jgi:hypothetical protein
VEPAGPELPQRKHAVAETAPPVGLKVPGGQRVHCAAEERPVRIAKVPAGQGEQGSPPSTVIAALKYMPRGHTPAELMHSADPLLEYRPAAQVVQLAEDIEPGVFENLPAGHFEQRMLLSAL